jgi:PIN like domain
VKVFFDNCTSPVLATTVDGFIRSAGHSANHIKDLPCGRDATDLEWIEMLARERRVCRCRSELVRNIQIPPIRVIETQFNRTISVLVGSGATSIITVWSSGSSHWSLRSTIGAAAKQSNPIRSVNPSSASTAIDGKLVAEIHRVRKSSRP